MVWVAVKASSVHEKGLKRIEEQAMTVTCALLRWQSNQAWCGCYKELGGAMRVMVALNELKRSQACFCGSERNAKQPDM